MMVALIWEENEGKVPKVLVPVKLSASPEVAYLANKTPPKRGII